MKRLLRSHVESAVKTSLAEGSYITVVYWQIKFVRIFDQVPIFLKTVLFDGGRKLSVVDIKIYMHITVNELQSKQVQTLSYFIRFLSMQKKHN